MLEEIMREKQEVQKTLSRLKSQMEDLIDNKKVRDIDYDMDVQMLSLRCGILRRKIKKLESKINNMRRALEK